MSALGHKRTFRSAIAMSALLPKADMCSASRNVRYGPIADIASSYRASMSSSFHVLNCNSIPVSYRPIGSIVADARCHLLARCPFPRRRGFSRRAGKALDRPDASRLAQSQAPAVAEKSGRAVDASQGAVRAQIDAVSRPAALDRRRFRWLPRRRRVAANHWTDLAGYAAVA